MYIHLLRERVHVCGKMVDSDRLVSKLDFLFAIIYVDYIQPVPRKDN